MNLVFQYEKLEREVQRIMSGPIPMEKTPKKIWEAALLEAREAAAAGAKACADAGISY